MVDAANHCTRRAPKGVTVKGAIAHLIERAARLEEYGLRCSSRMGNGGPLMESARLLKLAEELEAMPESLSKWELTRMGYNVIA